MDQTFDKKNKCKHWLVILWFFIDPDMWWMKEKHKQEWMSSFAVNQLSSVWSLVVQSPLRNPTNLDRANSVTRSLPA